MFADLNEKLSSVFKRLKGEARISEANIAEAVKQVRMALLEADVNYKVVKSFVSGVQEAALGESVINSVSPAQQFIKIVHDNLVEILGGKDYEPSLPLQPIPPTIIMLSGLQGSGKTTSAGKLGRYFAKDGKNVLLIAADIYRPAAIDQLEVLGKNLNIDVYSDKSSKDAVKIARDGLEYAKKAAKDVVIVDTAGRLHIDEELMQEVENVKKAIAPHYTFFVADAMTGQDAVNAATEFNNRLEVTGVILTKTDGDARGGAALSIRYATGKPLMFIGTGEKPDEFELFHPDRMASRILGMGDIVSLVERAQEVIDIEEAESMADKIKTGLDYNDILKQFSMMNKMGSLESILKMIPGLPKISSADIDESRIKRTQAIIYSMTKRERTKQDALNGSRKKRIARGAGVSVNEVNKLIDQLTNMNKMMKKVSRKVGGKTPDMNMKDLAKIMKGMKF
ncbi:MAG: signal recognition particle protein [Mucispirillum sp.]|nr:signal recognition particle protein [Mucispirillum sp.]